MRVDSCSSCQAPQQTTAAARAAAVAGAVRSTSLDLTVTTADGDRVTLSASQSASIGGVATSDGRRAGTSTSASTFSLAVEGSLDRGELRDLRKVLKLLAKAAADQDAGRLASRLSRPDMDSIASMQASMTESVAVVGGVIALGPAPSAASASPETEVPA